MIELLKHFFGLCFDHWHPNVWTLAAGSPIVIASINYIRCKCGGLFNHKKSCNEREN